GSHRGGSRGQGRRAGAEVAFSRICRLVLLPGFDVDQHVVAGWLHLRDAAAALESRVRPPTGARTLDSRAAFYYGYTMDSPGMRVPNVGSQYLMGFMDADKNYLDGGKTYKVTLPPNIPEAAFWSFTVYDNQTRSMLQTPQRYPRAGSQSYPSPAAEADADGSTTIYFGPPQPE